MLKTLTKIPSIISTILLLTACGISETREETTEFKDWLKTTHNPTSYKNIQYKDITLTEPIETEIKPILQSIQETLPKNRIQIEVEDFTKENWFYRECSNFTDAENNVILAPLSEPIIGDIINPIFQGYASQQQITELLTTLEFKTTNTLPDEHIFSGSDILPEYPIKVTTGFKETENFTIQIIWNNEWNIYLWEGYYEIEDPGRWNFETYPYPTYEYAPFKVIINFKQPCVDQ